MKSKTFIFSCLLIAAQAFGQQNYWSKLKDPKISRENLNPRWTNPNTFSLYQVDLEKIKADLKKAPQRFSGNESVIIKFPDSDGNIRDYIVQEASVMEPELQAKFPEIRSYTGWQKNHPENTIRFSVTPSTGISVMYFDTWDISYLDRITGAGTKALANGNLHQLQFLRIFYCFYCDRITDEGIKALANGNLHQLQSLVISHCDKITDAGIKALMNGLPQLQSLDIRTCKYISDAGLMIPPI
jgi:hypothetical protein